MRFHIVLRYVALSLLLDAVFMGISCIISAFHGDAALLPLLYSTLVVALFGLFPLIFVPSTASITNKEGLSIVVMSWFLSCLAGTLPYVLWGGPFTFTNAWFESVSGFTTIEKRVFGENISFRSSLICSILLFSILITGSSSTSLFPDIFLYFSDFSLKSMSSSSHFSAI